MSFEIIDTDFLGLKIVKPHLFKDERGIYKKHFESDFFKNNGLTFNVSESSDIYSDKGVIRGLHYQEVESQAKLIRVIKGKIFDVAVDMRPNSKTYMKSFSVILDDKDFKGVLIPEGFAHGFMCLENNTVFSYNCSGRYLPEYCGGLRWNDPKLNINWPLREFNVNKITLSEKDKNWKLI